MRNKIIGLCFVSFLFLGNVFCDTITFKSGKQVEGNIKEKTSDAVRVDMEGMTITYYLMDIDSINGQKIAAEPAVATENATPENTSLSTETYSSGNEGSSGLQGSQMPANSEETVPGAAPKSISNSDPEPSVPLEEKGTGSLEMSPTSKRSAISPGFAAGLVGGMILVGLLIGLIIYVYTSICLYFIAKKTGSEPLFLAWIPFGHFFLRFKIARMNYLWIFVPVGIILISFMSGFSLSLIGALSGANKVPVTANPIFMIINFFLTAIYAAFSGYLWYKIALARNKKGWIGALMAISILNGIPFISFISIIGCGVVMGYLAFSE